MIGNCNIAVHPPKNGSFILVCIDIFDENNEWMEKTHFYALGKMDEIKDAIQDKINFFCFPSNKGKKFFVQKTFNNEKL